MKRHLAPMFSDASDERRRRVFLVSDYEHEGDLAHAETTLVEMGFTVAAAVAGVDDDGEDFGKVFVDCTAAEAAIIRDSI